VSAWEAFASIVSIRTPWESQVERGNRADGSVGAGPVGPVLHEPQPRLTGLTYEPFYGLREKPFSLTSDSRFFYHSRSHAPAYDDLLGGIRRRESLNVLSGDIGTGKTTLCRAVLQNLDRKTFSAFVQDPFVSREDLLKVLLMDFGVVSVDDLTSGRLKDATRTELSYLLYEFLGTLAPLQAFAVVIIDEAQNLSVPLLEEIRILSDADGQLQVVLVGQLELRDKLKLPEMRQVDQRVSVHCNLAPLSCDGVAGYIAHRLQTAGGSPDRVRFSAEAVEMIYGMTGGVPRLINRICDRALHHGYLRRVASIDREIVEAAMPESAGAPTPASAPKPAAAPAPKPAPAPAAVAVAVAVPVDRPVSPLGPAIPQFPDPVDVWLAVVDDETKAAALRPAPAPCSAEVPRPDRLIPRVPPLTESSDPAATAKLLAKVAPRQQVQRTHMERFTRRWVRRLGLGAVAGTALLIALLGGPSFLEISGALWAQSTELFTPPELPALPAEVPAQVAPAVQLPSAPADELLSDVAAPAAAVRGARPAAGADAPK
jgi:type II secretory pathway predicted ATPase ExeA